MTKRSIFVLVMLLASIYPVLSLQPNDGMIVDKETTSIKFQGKEYPIEISHQDDQRVVSINGNGAPIQHFDMDLVYQQVGSVSKLEINFAPDTILEGSVYDTELVLTSSDNTIIRNNEFNNLYTALTITSSENVTIESNLFKNSYYQGGTVRAISIDTSNNIEILDNVFQGHRSTSSIQIIYVIRSHNVEITNNEMKDFEANEVYGVYSGYSTFIAENYSISENQIKDVTTPFFIGFYLWSVLNLTIKANEISDMSVSEYFKGTKITWSNDSYIAGNEIHNIYYSSRFYGFEDQYNRNATYEGNIISLIKGENLYFYGLYSMYSEDVNAFMNIIRFVILTSQADYQGKMYGFYILNSEGLTNYTGNEIYGVQYTSKTNFFFYGYYTSTYELFMKHNSIMHINATVFEQGDDYYFKGLYGSYHNGRVYANTIYDCRLDTTLSNDFSFVGIDLWGNDTIVDDNYVSTIISGTTSKPTYRVPFVDGLHIRGFTSTSNITITNNVVTDIAVVVEANSQSYAEVNGILVNDIAVSDSYDVMISDNAINNINVTNIRPTSSYAVINAIKVHEVKNSVSILSNYISNIFGFGFSGNETRGINVNYNTNNSIISHNLIHTDNFQKYKFTDAYNLDLTIDYITGPKEFVFYYNQITSYVLNKDGSQIGAGTEDYVLIDITGLTDVHEYEIVILTAEGTTITSTIAFDIIVISYQLALFGRLLSPSNEITAGEVVDIAYLIYGDPTTYNFVEDSTSLDAGTWYSGQTLLYTIDTFSYAESEYLYSMTVFDADSNEEYMGIVIDVRADTNTPQILLIKADSGYQQGYDGISVDWMIFDSNGGIFDVYVNNTIWMDGEYASYSFISFLIDFLPYGLWNVTIAVTDAFGNEAQYEVFVNLLKDQSAPTTAYPTSEITLVYEENATEQQLFWTFYDRNPVDYELFQNGTKVGFGSYESYETIYYNLTDLDIGYHNFTIVVYDINDNTLTYEIMVHVTYDDVLPEIDVTGPTSYEVDEIGNDLSITLADANPTSYGIEVDGVTSTNATYLAGDEISFNIDGLDVGIHLIKIYAYDTNGNVKVHVHAVNVLTDQTAPIVSGISSTSFYEGDEKNITFTYSDLHLWMYSVLIDGVTDISGFVSGDSLTYDLSHLRADLSNSQIFNVTLLVNDTYGNFGMYSSSVTVYRDNTAPVMQTYPLSSYSISNDETVSLTFVVTDKNPSNYTMTLDGEVVKSGDYFSGEEITYVFSSTVAGYYTIYVSFFDLRGLQAYYSVTIQVIARVDPSITLNSPSSMDINEGDLGYQIEWQVFDDSPDYYEITQDGTLMSSNTWYDGQMIFFNLDSLSSGTYTIMLKIFDTEGNSATSSVVVNVIAQSNTGPGDPVSEDPDDVSRGGFLPILMIYQLLAGFIVLVAVRKRIE
ncbi:MAG: hypothetical protein INQ03_11230 [Candidatus Heimdallarchaeota archaeon]|nr:hypothetical protein [Candidatus Heimdallarchaeota archaeon]